MHARVLAPGPLRANGHVEPHLKVREAVLVWLRSVPGPPGQQEGSRPSPSARQQREAAVLVQLRAQEPLLVGLVGDAWSPGS